jgi:peroxiredoxin
MMCDVSNDLPFDLYRPRPVAAASAASLALADGVAPALASAVRLVEQLVAWPEIDTSQCDHKKRQKSERMR